MATPVQRMNQHVRFNNGLIDLWEHAALLYHGYEWQGAAAAFTFLAKHVEDQELRQLCSINISLIQARIGEYRIARDTLLDGSTNRISLALTPYILGLIEWELGHAIQAESCLNASLDLLLRHGPEDLNSRGMAFVLRAEDVRMHLDLLRESRLRTGLGEAMPVIAMRMTAERIFEAPARTTSPWDDQARQAQGGPNTSSRPYSGELLQPTIYVPPDTEAIHSRRKAVDSRMGSKEQEGSPTVVGSPLAERPQRPSTRPKLVVSSLYSNDDDDDLEMQARVSRILSAAGRNAPGPELLSQQPSIPQSRPGPSQTYRTIAEEVDDAFSRGSTPSLRLSSGGRPKPKPRSSIMSTKSMAFGSALPEVRPKYVPLMAAAKARGTNQTAPLGLTNMTVTSPQASNDIRQASIGLASQPSLQQRPSVHSVHTISSRPRSSTVVDHPPFVTVTSAVRENDSRATVSSSLPGRSSTDRKNTDSERRFLPNTGLRRDAVREASLPAHPRFGRWTEDKELKDDWLDKVSRKIAGPPSQLRIRRDSKKRDSGSTSSSKHGFSPIFSRFRSGSKQISISPPEFEKKPVFSSRPLDARKNTQKTARDPRDEQEDLRLLAQFVREYDGTPFPELSRRLLARNNALDDLVRPDNDDEEAEPTTTDLELAIFLRNAARDRLCLDADGKFNYRHAREDMLIGAPDPFLNALTLRNAKKRNSAPEDLEKSKCGTITSFPNRRQDQDLALDLLLPRDYDPCHSLPQPGDYKTYNPFISRSSCPPTPSTTSTRHSIQLLPGPPTPRRPGAWDHLHTAASSSSSLFADSISSLERRRRATDAALRMLEGRCRVRRDGKGDVVGRETVRGGWNEHKDQLRSLREGGKGKRATGGTAGFQRAVGERGRRGEEGRRKQMDEQYERQLAEWQKQQQQAQQSVQRQQQSSPRPQPPQQESGSEGESIADSLTPAPLRIASSKIFGLGAWEGKGKHL